MSNKLSNQEKARRLWVHALRSGKYGWGKEELHPTDDKFCCLGVLTDLYIKEKKLKWKKIPTEDDKLGFEYEAHYLSPKIQVWANIASQGSYKENDNLAYDNDNGVTFKEIANIIKKNF